VLYLHCIAYRVCAVRAAGPPEAFKGLANKGGSIVCDSVG